jgi:hypothetical protein
MQNVKVQDQSETEVRQLQVRENLCEMYVIDRFDGFDLQNQPPLDHDIHTIPAIELDVAIN